MEKLDVQFYKWEKTAANKPFLHQPFGDTWETYTWGQVGQMARKMASALHSLNLPPKSHIGLVSKNCREWIIADIAIQMAGYVSVPFYATLTGTQLKEVIQLGDVAAIFVGKLEVWENMKTGVPEGMPMIAFPQYKDHDKVEGALEWNDLLAKHEPLQGTPQPNMDDIWSIVFTSGTTGTPKGVMLTYRQSDATKIVAETTNPVKIDHNGNNRFFSYLPLNHIAERVVVENTCMRYGGEIFFAESLTTFAKNLQHARPTVFFAVPRIWTKFQMGVLSKMPQKKLDRLLKIPIVSGIIKKKIRTGLGLNDARGWISGAAPITESMKNWYRKIGINITDGYGMTENCAICTTTFGDDFKPGTTGKAQPGVTLRIDEETSEIQMRADFVMEGYYKNPEKTAEVIRDGWLCTGDQGHIDKDGYLFITGRVKDTFKTTKGKYIIPAPIEWKFGDNKDIEQICIVGRGCPQPIGLVVPSEIGIKKSTEELQESLNSTLTNVNGKLENYKKVSTLIVTKEPWSVENGLLTPTLKVKRNVLSRKYETNLMNWHEENSNVIIE